jgi:hypothetical protein
MANLRASAPPSTARPRAETRRRAQAARIRRTSPRTQRRRAHRHTRTVTLSCKRSAAVDEQYDLHLERPGPRAEIRGVRARLRLAPHSVARLRLRLRALVFPGPRARRKRRHAHRRDLRVRALRPPPHAPPGVRGLTRARRSVAAAARYSRTRAFSAVLMRASSASVVCAAPA